MKKLRYLLLALVPALVLMVSACANDGDGSNGGSAGRPVDPRCVKIDNVTGYDNNSNGTWEIYNENGLKNFQDNVTANRNINAKLVCDITLTNKADNISWVPINPYNGTFDGDNYTISGLYINNSSNQQGLFGYTGTNATIKNLIVEDVEIVASDFVGAISGYNDGDIINVHVDNVTINATRAIGAIAGQNDGNILASSASFIVITSTATGGIIGGIIGVSNGDIVATYVDNATITANDTNASLGGIIGVSFEGSIVSSYTNDVTFVHDSNNQNVGGIVGFNFNRTLSSNFFVSDGSLNGLGNTGNNTEAEPVASKHELNTKINDMNTAIDEYNKTVTIAVRYKFINNGANPPVLQETDIAIRGFAISTNDQYLQIDDTVDIRAVPTPNNAITIIDWNNSNPNVATLDNGTITAIGYGDTTITASIVGTNFESKIIIRVEYLGYEIIDNTYKISNVSGLQAFRDATVNDNTTNGLLVDNITFIPQEYFTNNNWMPIGSFSVPDTTSYAGTFDGDNYTISGLYINDNTSDEQGLFGYTGTNATIKNLIVEDVEIVASDFVGAISGYNEGDIINVHVDNVTIDANRNVGAITGGNAGNIYASSASSIDITVSDTSIGGIAGANGGDIVATYIDNATITANNRDDISIGGITGNYESGKIVSSYTNNVKFVHDVNNIYVGGIVGLNDKGVLSSNYFVSDNESLFGVGAKYDAVSGTNIEVTDEVDNATRVETIQALNDNVTKMNGGIGLYDTLFGFEYEVLKAPNNATKVPTLVRKP